MLRRVRDCVWCAHKEEERKRAISNRFPQWVPVHSSAIYGDLGNIRVIVVDVTSYVLNLTEQHRSSSLGERIKLMRWRLGIPNLGSRCQFVSERFFAPVDTLPVPT
ncbi:hypothetical protein QCA50_014636 [Cerrena zonata]|uniref:Uncharacterized protein n=1 Tax=Cerrena zonata TaxID=2478898 RepID=A0AAW0FP11_9APHY